MKLQDFVSTDELDALYRPAGEAQGLPARVYIDPDFWELERERYFARTWMACAFESDVPCAGDVFPVSIGGWELLVVRGNDARVRVFHNICAHRGMRLVDAPGRVENRLRCPWHSWSYALDGSLAGTPNLAGVGVDTAPGFDRPGLGLKAVRTETWLNFVLVNIDGNAPDLESHLGPVRRRLADHDLSVLAHGGLATEVEFHGNWKLAYEGGVEDYHIPWIHPTLGAHAGTYRADLKGVPTYVGITSRVPVGDRDTPGRATLRGTSEDGELPVFPHLAANPPTDGLGFETMLMFMPPSAVLAVLGNHIATRMFVPVAMDRTVHRMTFLFVGEGAHDAKYARQREQVRDIWHRVGVEDRPLVGALQKQHRLRAELDMPTRFSPYWEPAVHRFQQLVVEKLQGGEGTARHGPR